MHDWLTRLDHHFPVRYTAWLLCAGNGAAAWNVALVYFDIGSQKETLLHEEHTALGLRAYFDKQCGLFLQWAEKEMAHREARDAQGILGLAAQEAGDIARDEKAQHHRQGQPAKGPGQGTADGHPGGTDGQPTAQQARIAQRAQLCVRHIGQAPVGRQSGGRQQPFRQPRRHLTPMASKRLAGRDAHPAVRALPPSRHRLDVEHDDVSTLGLGTANRLGLAFAYQRMDDRFEQLEVLQFSVRNAHAGDEPAFCVVEKGVGKGQNLCRDLGLPVRLLRVDQSESGSEHPADQRADFRDRVVQSRFVQQPFQGMIAPTTPSGSRRKTFVSIQLSLSIPRSMIRVCLSPGSRGR